MSNTDSLHYRCPNCEHALQVDPGMIGQAIACPSCSQPVTFKVERAIPIKGPEAGEQVHAIDSDPDAIEGSGYETDIDVRHPAMFRSHPLRWLIVVALALAGLGGAAWLRLEEGQDIAAYAALAVGVVALGYFVYWWLKTRFTRLRITNQRTIYREGIVAKQSSEVRHDDVRNLKVDQSAGERIVGVGDVAISSAGQDGLEIVAEGIPRPDEVVDVIRAHQNPG